MLLLILALLAGSPDSAVVRDIVVAPGEALRTTTAGAGQPVVLIPGFFGAAFGYRPITGTLAAPWVTNAVVREYTGAQTADMHASLRARLPDFRSDSDSGAGQYVQEEQPAVVLVALARVDEESR